MVRLVVYFRWSPRAESGIRP